MRIAIFSDIHGNIDALDAVCAHMGQVDRIWFAGDFSGYYYAVNDVVDRIRTYNNVCILGNHDVHLLKFTGFGFPAWSEARKGRIVSRDEYKKKYGLGIEVAIEELSKINLEFLSGLEIESTVTVDGKIVKLVHGSPRDPFAEYIYPDHKDWDKFLEVAADIIVMGHTHYPLVKKIGDKLIINPGSVGQPRDYDPRASYAVLDTSTWTTEIKRVAYPQERLFERIHQLEPTNKKLRSILERRRVQ